MTARPVWNFCRFFFVLLLLCGFSGCKPKNPLDQKVEAETPAAFAEWWTDARYDFPDDLAQEVSNAFDSLKENTPRRRPEKQDDPADPFCQRIHHVTVRHVLIDAYNQQNRGLLNRVLLETSNLEERLKSAAEQGTAADFNRQERITAFYKKLIDQLSTQIEHNRVRIAELSHDE
jgi:hypothetical protein